MHFDIYRIIEYTDLEGTHWEHQIRLRALHRVPQEPHNQPEINSSFFMSCSRCLGKNAKHLFFYYYFFILTLTFHRKSVQTNFLSYIFPFWGMLHCDCDGSA